MEPSIIAAIIGALATVLAVVIGWWLPQRKATRSKSAESIKFQPDKDGIYFMQYLLHDAYEQQTPLSTTELAEHHRDYAPLELEVKLIELENHGYVQRVTRKNTGMGKWQITPKGVEFMFKHGHQLHDLVEESRSNA